MRDFFHGWRRKNCDVTLGLACVTTGCSREEPDVPTMTASKKKVAPTAKRMLTPDELRIVEIAEEVVKSHHRGEIESESPVWTESGWSVIIWNLPKVPCGDQTVHLDEDGHVTWIYPW